MIRLPAINGRIDRPRDISFERALTIAAATSAGRNPAEIIRLAEARAPLTPIREFLLRDLTMDGLEEGADWRNYICWDVLRLDLSNRNDPEALAARAALHQALAAVVTAFEQHRLAGQLLSPHARQKA